MKAVCFTEISVVFTRLQGIKAVFDIYEHSSLLEYDAVSTGFFRPCEAACCLHVVLKNHKIEGSSPGH
jgi:hypothetical protein